MYVSLVMQTVEMTRMHFYDVVIMDFRIDPE